MTRGAILVALCIAMALVGCGKYGRPKRTGSNSATSPSSLAAIDEPTARPSSGRPSVAEIPSS